MGFLDFVEELAGAISEAAPQGSREALSSWFEMGRKGGSVGRARTSPVPAGSVSAGTERLSSSLRMEQDIARRFSDYEEMDNYPEISSAIDIFADDASVTDTATGKSVWIVSENRSVAKILTAMLDAIRIEEKVWPLARTVTKYGNCYGELLISDGLGVTGINWLPVPTVRRVESRKGELFGFVQDSSEKFNVDVAKFAELLSKGGKIDETETDNSSVVSFSPWEVVHWKLEGKHLSPVYGSSVLEPVRWVFRRLVMMEDQMLVHKLTRSPGRLVYYVDVGNLPKDEAMSYLNEVKVRLRKKGTVTGPTGQLDFRANPISPDEDIILPTRGGKESTRIDTLSGNDYQSIEDVIYFRDKMVAGLKVPKAYYGMAENASRGSLSQEDVRFAKTVMRIQREVRNGIKQVCRVHLAAVGIDPDKVKWEVMMASPSSIFELAQIEVRNAQADLASRMEPFVSKPWVLKHIFRFSDGDADSVLRKKRDDAESDLMADAEVQSRIINKFPEISGSVQVASGETADNEEFRPAEAAARRSGSARMMRLLESVDNKVGRIGRELPADVRRLSKDLTRLLHSSHA